MEGFIGQITMFAGNYSPFKWAFCYGQITAITGNEALFSLLGNTYGGDGRSSFGFPDMRGRLPMGFGSGRGLTPTQIGTMKGVETVTLDISQIPSHSHNFQVSNNTATGTSPGGQVLGKADMYCEPATAQYNDGPSAMYDGIIASKGSNHAHENKMPSLGVNFIICLNGIYPPRN
ncbi:phage tail protein [Pseudoalteromonas rhizosphaerae]|uniref:phage tail protein n=1 Tax=Pseudoalteromonas rhizosphaerae TaxID=2518973 RepID=UPI00214747FF|nr:tail fiber protein [Pseudoalteromonas rhizosphaerae]